MNIQTADNATLDKIALANDAKQGERMFAQVYDFLGRFVVYPSDHARVAHALWILHSHLMDRWDATPRLAFLSAEPESGKTRALEITELLVPRPVSAVNVTPSYLFRKIGSEEGAPTVLYDEIDTVFGPKAKDNEEIRGLLNAGHRRGAVAGRCVVRGKTVETEELPAYAAVALAGLGWLPDTILGRSVIVRMRRRHGGELVEPYRRRIVAPQGERVRSAIEIWARSVPQEIMWPDMPNEVVDRAADCWEPLLAVADLIGGEWRDRARAAAVTLVTASREVDPSLGIRLLGDLRTIFGDNEVMASKIILQKLCEIEESPWGDLKGKPLDDRGLAQRLKQYGVKSKVVRIGTTTVRGYTRADLHDQWQRYLPPSPANSVTSITSATMVPFQRDVADVSQVTHLAGNGRRCCAQCGGDDDGTVQAFRSDGRLVYLHPQCRRFYRGQVTP